MALKNFVRGSATFNCSECGRKTRATEQTQIDLKVCAQCLAEMENENALADGHPELVQDIPSLPSRARTKSPGPAPKANYLSVQEAAEKLGRRAKDVRRLLRSGALEGRKENGEWNVLEQSVLEYKPGSTQRPRFETAPKKIIAKSSAPRAAGPRDVSGHRPDDSLTRERAIYICSDGHRDPHYWDPLTSKDLKSRPVNTFTVNRECPRHAPAPSAETLRLRREGKEESRRLRKQYPKFWDNIPEEGGE